MGHRVLIVDDHPGFRASARRLLECEGFQVVGEAEDAAAARSAVRELRPDLILLDIQLPDADGRDLAAELAGEGDAGPDVLLISSRDDGCAGASGAIGFVPKDRLSGAAITALLE